MGLAAAQHYDVIGGYVSVGRQRIMNEFIKSVDYSMSAVIHICILEKSVQEKIRDVSSKFLFCFHRVLGVQYK